MTARINHLLLKSTQGRASDAYDLDDLYDDISSSWQEKAERFQRRRWRKIMKHGSD